MRDAADVSWASRTSSAREKILFCRAAFWGWMLQQNFKKSPLFGGLEATTKFKKGYSFR
jgi:hypothetical protein